MVTRPAARDAAAGSRSALPLPPRTLVGFAIAVLAVVVIAFVSYRALAQRASTAERVMQSTDALQSFAAFNATLREAETSQRNYLLTGDEADLQALMGAKPTLAREFQTARSLTAGDAGQQRRLDRLEQIAAERIEQLDETTAAQRAGDNRTALQQVRSNRGKAVMDRFRAALTEIEASERTLLAAREAEWQRTIDFSTRVTSAGSLVLLLLIAMAALAASREHRAREAQIWLRAGQAGLSLRVQGEQRLDQLGDKVLAFLGEYLNAQVGALYIRQGGGFQRVAALALPDAGSAGAVLRPGDGLLGQAAKENRTLHVREVPDGYLPIVSALGRGAPNELLIAPASVDGVVHGVIELGFLRRLLPQDRELLERVSELLGVAVRASKDRSRLEELLAETQRQAEELQAQQEELRVSNEELEEQAHALKDSQARLEVQQTELEQTNSHLEEQTQLLEAQKDELARSERIVTEKADELERANRYKSEFLANMSHELRTPLNSTLILAKLLADNRDGNLSAEQVKFAQTISSAGNDLLTLINDILDLSKIEAGKVDVHAEPVSTARTVEGLVQSLRPLAQQRGLTLATEIAPGTPERLVTDPQRLGQILKNLLSNALKFTQRGEVALEVAPGPGETVAFAVRDTGIGIAEHQQELIFEAFRQADGSTHRKYGGTGLGLSISRDLAQLLGGDIAVRSTPGQGSVFTLTLPLAYVPRADADADVGAAPGPTPPRAARAPAAPAAPAPARRAPAPADPAAAAVADDRDRLSADARLILVIEDDVRFAAILRDLAHEMDFQCVVAHSAGSGLAAALAYRPSAILLDMNLPDHSGLGVLDQLKRNAKTRHIPVHVMSVADYAHEALELGAVGYDMKPVERTQIVGALRRLEDKFSQRLRRVLVVEDDARQRDSIRQLLDNDEVGITTVETGAAALAQLKSTTFDCMIMDLNLPDLSGFELLERMAAHDDTSFPPVIVYTGRSLSRHEEEQLRRFSRSIIIKDARSPERLLDEVTLFLHQVESTLPAEVQRMLQSVRDRDATLDGRRILVVEDDVRNVFALTSVLEPKGATVEIARNGREALDALARSRSNGAAPIDLVLMDIMMPEMDGLTAMREIRRQPHWKKLPIVALTAKAMKDDQENCLAAGANDYIAKPLDVEKLLSLVRVWMPK